MYKEKEFCDCCDGLGYIKEYNGEMSSCMTCCGSGYHSYSPFFKLLEFNDSNIRKELDNYYIVSKNHVKNIEDNFTRITEENKRLKKRVDGH